MAAAKQLGQYYVYTGTNSVGEKEQGMVYANSLDAAKKMAAKRIKKVNNCFADPIANLTWSLRGGYEKVQVARMFQVMADNLERGSSLPESISMARMFVNDPYLKCGCSHLTDLMSSGKSLGAAMRATHFSTADCTIVESVRGGSQGGYANAFKIRAEALGFEANGEKDLNKALIPFFFFFTFIVFMMYFLLFKAGAGAVDLLANVIPEKNQTGFVGGYIGFMNGLQENKTIFTICYFAGAAAIMLPLALPQTRVKAISSVFKSYGKFKLELDQYKTWQLWQLMRVVGIDNIRIFTLASTIVTSEVVANQNKTIAAQTKRGRGLHSIVKDVVKSPVLRDQLSSVLGGKASDKGMEIVLSLLQLQIDEYKNKAVSRFSGATKGIVAIALISMFVMIMAPSFMLMTNVS